MAFTFNFAGKEVTPAPFVVKWDYNLAFSGSETTPTDSYPYQDDEFTTVTQIGDIIDVKTLLKDKFNEYRTAGEIVSENFTIINYEFEDVSYDIEITLSYNPAQPNILGFYIPNPSGYPTSTISLDYSTDDAGTWEQLEHCFCVTMINLDNMPEFQYNNKYVVNLCAFRPSYWQSTITRVVDTLIPSVEYHDEFTRVPVTMFNISPMDSAVRSLVSETTPILNGTANGFYINNFEDDDGNVKTCGVSTRYIFNTLGEVKINGVEIDFDKIGSETPEDDTSGGNGWTTGFSITSTPIDFPPVPSIDALSTGFIHAYYLAPSVSVSLANYMLTDDFIQNVKKLLGNPIDYVAGASMMPFSVSGTSEHIRMGGIDTEIEGTRILSQYKVLECGTVVCPFAWKGFPDFSATRVSIFLPFIGIRQLDVSDVMGATLTLKYYVDVLTGACIAIIKCNNMGNSAPRKLNSVMYHFNGKMGVSIPITSKDYTGNISNLFTGAVNVGSSFASENPAGVVGGATSMLQGALGKPPINRSGNLAGDAGMLDNYTPYLIIEYPTQFLPSNYKNLRGYASKIGGTFSDFSGYLEIDEINLDNVPITDAEKERLLNKLKGGVFV